MGTPIRPVDFQHRLVDIPATQMRAPNTRAIGVEGRPFRDVLTEAIGEVQNLQTEADNTIKKLVAGEMADATEALVAVQKADMAFQTMMTVRNKVMEAYQEIMRMQV